MMVVKSVSLVELKKQQWAKEKELVKLNSYWRNQNTPIVFNDQRGHVIYPEIRSNDIDRLAIYKDLQTQKNLSFPPISQDNQKQNLHKNTYINKIEKDLNIDTGVMDDSKPKSTHTILNRTYTISKENNTNERGGTLERQKWDKQYNALNGGLNDQNFNSNEKKYLTNEKNETPTWVEYSSENPSATNEIGKTQFQNTHKPSDFGGSCDTLSSLDSNNVYNRTYLLGQNIPLTSEELAAREIKRQKAMELQEAIKQQLKERQLKKKEELEKKKQDDLVEERRIQRQQEIEKKRLEDELKRQREKELFDERKAKAMQEVLENAQKQAKEDKSKHMQKKRQNQEEIKDKISTEPTVVVSNSSESCEPKCETKCEPKCETKICLEPKAQLNTSSPVEIKEIPKLPDVDVTLQTSLSPLNHQKVLTPSKFRNQTTSVAIQTDILKKPVKTSVGNAYQKSIDLDQRPKWGVNRPEVQYIKQSAKDPNYQLKLRQKSPWTRRINNANSAKSQSPNVNGRAGLTFPDNYSKKTFAYGRPNFAEMKNSNSVSNKTPSLSESISVSDVLYQLSSLRKVLETKRKHWKSVIADESPSSDSS
ncbi:PREDICTED: histone-lysine N-methyltransferase, H3 lysine-79 specific isoform X2 [Diuraphis noxia]|uniref:histone-lysine N-methyltransferase, H3 lysine-79 specific isoform X2 n=1 Tax=Diuraphis noxia TaxID=143948 RepID=UPI00076392D8|nr:PREDICTED: histone-lysine N-methyltransferase, H3 lysine-79 specific isoform X2 [Diuraphis noxia]